MEAEEEIWKVSLQSRVGIPSLRWALWLKDRAKDRVNNAWNKETECQVDIVDGDNAAEIVGEQRGRMMTLLANERAGELSELPVDSPLSPSFPSPSALYLSRFLVRTPSGYSSQLACLWLSNSLTNTFRAQSLLTHSISSPIYFQSLLVTTHSSSALTCPQALDKSRVSSTVCRNYYKWFFRVRNSDLRHQVAKGRFFDYNVAIWAYLGGKFCCLCYLLI